ncbi:MAG: hypothetical protein E6R03_07815 [Hyphomicrobiaceae bacterium]|nr:MAG: hypothetical protein E6R03_07815 [Hyphomicrobiaceae bacterium]
MLKTFYACPCGKRPASFEIFISGKPTNERYPFVCGPCLNADIMKFFNEHKTDAPLPEWKVDERGTFIQTGEQESVDFSPRPHGIETSEDRTFELRKKVEVLVLTIEFAGDSATPKSINKLPIVTTPPK